MSKGSKAGYAIVTCLTLAWTGQICRSDSSECFRQLAPNWNAPGMKTASTNVKLEGISKGGELVLMQMMNPNPRYIRIDTHSGETAETIIARVAAAINEVSPFNAHFRWQVRAEGNLLKALPGSPGAYIFSGTETGLGIPAPPTSLSASYDAQYHIVSLYWENPDAPYDAIRVSGGSDRILDGTAMKTVFKGSGPPAKQAVSPNVVSHEALRANKGLRRCCVIGCRNGVLSNAAVITLNYTENSQEELDTQPFTAGISPNWKAWSQGGEPDKLVLEEGTKGQRKRFDQEPGAPVERGDKQYFQLIKTRSADVTGGVCRKFLGLQPGHTYRLHVRMNTFDMDRVQDDWSFSFHGVPHAKGITLSAAQMAGTAALPGGGSGALAGRIVSCGPGSTTKGQFAEFSTEKAGADGQTHDITLPAGAEVITVWFRYTGPPCSGVGFDWIKLKDVTAK